MDDPSYKKDEVWLHGARCALGPRETYRASIQIIGGRLTQVMQDRPPSPLASGVTEIDLTGFLLLPGLVNAHDHLQFALYPRLANPPYQNYVGWGEDIHSRFPEVIATHKSVPKDVRLWWGGIRNLLCGVTTVCHHNKLWSELQRSEFPIKVVQHFGWGHSLALGGDLHAARLATPEGSVFILHACEGVDDQARDEVFKLDELGLLDAHTVLVHGLAMDSAGIALVQERQTSLIVCPSSNMFLFGKLPDMDALGRIENVTLGSDSPLTAAGDLLDEIRFAIRSCSVPPEMAYRMVTESAANTLKLKDGEGAIRISGPGDVVGIQNTGQNAAETLQTLSMADIEFVMISGSVQLASEKVWRRLPSQFKKGLEPLSVDGMVRWLRAPVKELIRQTEEVLGPGRVRLGGRKICSPVLQ